MSDDLGQDIVRRRGEVRMTLRATAAKIGVSASLLSMIEQGKHVPSPKMIVKLAQLLGADPDGWCALAGRVTPEAEAALAELAREDPEGYRFLRTRVVRRGAG